MDAAIAFLRTGEVTKRSEPLLADEIATEREEEIDAHPPEARAIEPRCAEVEDPRGKNITQTTAKARSKSRPATRFILQLFNSERVPGSRT